MTTHSMSIAAGEGVIDRFPAMDWKEFGTALLNATPNGVAVFNTGFGAVISNSIARDRLGIYPGSLMETTCPSLYPHARKAMSGPLAGVNIKKRGHSFTALMSPVLHRTQAIGILCLFEDITAMEQIAGRLARVEELSMELDTIIDSSNDGLWICDGDGVVLRINPASEELTGVSAADMVGKPMQYLVENEIIDQSVTLKVLETRKKASIIQKTRTGKRLFLTGTPVFDNRGRLFRVVVNERDITEISHLQERLRENVELKAGYQRDLLEKQIEENESRNIIAKSDNYRRIVQKAVKLGEVDSSVLILGESGVGKGVLADLIHRYSARADHPMIRINCGSIPETLVESELFGYVKGAFTGARKQGKPGKFELADKGIIFLDEIAELPLASQVKLLKFLEDGVITRVGDTRSKQVDARIIAATNRDLKSMIAKKRFRSDLYYRLNVIPLKVPPLRERRDCLVPLLNHYLGRFCAKYDKPKIHLSADILDALAAYPYPGNVREMINICERMAVMSQAGEISFRDLPAGVQEHTDAGDAISLDMAQGLTLKEMVADLEKKILTAALREHGTQTLAARALGLNQSTIARKLKKYQI